MLAFDDYGRSASKNERSDIEESNLLKTPTHTYTCGTLTYTKAALAVLFFWLLWGDFCFTLMENVTGPIMLKKFETLGAMNWEVALLLSTIPGTFASFMNPVISFKSDRFRSKWGRRVPFLLAFLPFLVIALVGLAYGDRLGLWIYDYLHPAGISSARIQIWTLGTLLLIFTLFNVLGTTSFWYLFNDVVPEHLLARFMSWFRIISTLATMFYSFCIFPYSGTHSTQIFLGAAAIYFVGFGLMCLNVREGEYPPPPAYVGGGTGPVAMLKTYGKECHSNRIYWYLWLCTFVGGIGNGVVIFDLYFKQAIGLNMFEIGEIAGCNLFVVSLLVSIAGWLADRYHPIRVLLASQILGWIFLTPATLTWIFWHPSPEAMWTLHFPILQYIPYMHSWVVFPIKQVFLISLIIYVAIAGPLGALGCMWDPVMLMRTFPRSRLGQFCSINNLWRSVGGMLGTFLAGMYIDYLIVPLIGKEHAYFYLPLWQITFGIPSFILFLKFYQYWKVHGGDEYVAPVPGEEPVVETKTV